MTGLVAFLHGLTGNEHSWGAVPDYIRNSPLGANFEVATFNYSATVTAQSDIETSAQRVVTEIETTCPTHDPIYLIGHSLGGLVAREICRRLLEQGPDELLNRIPAVITVGTPLEGARFGNCWLRRAFFLSPKIAQLAKKELVFDNYRSAIRAAIQRSAGRPKQLHIRMEDDGVIAPHVKNNFTEDDIEAAVIPGTHTNFASNNADASYVANVLLNQIGTTQNALSRPHIVKSQPVVAPDLPDRLILIACSHGKRNGGDRGFGGPKPVDWIVEPGLRQRITSRRTYVYSVLNNAKLADGFERGGNRAHQPANQTLRYGPDFGGADVAGEEGAYLPAWKRYSGRAYSPVTQPAWENYFQNTSKIRVLIMSGLYGLIEPEEWIQNYDVHLTDTHVDTGQSISAMWSELFTECVENYVKHAYRERKVRIFNLLCDHHYVDSVKWHKLPRQCSVFHLASPTLEDVDFLPPAGTILNSFLLDPDKLETFESEDRNRTEYPLSDFGIPPVGLPDARMIFESRVGFSKHNV